MATRAKTVKPAEASRLSRDDWLDAAFNAVVEGGFDKARVLVIADALGVTRGSFYWHFTDHAEMIAALLARWGERELALGKQLRAETASFADPRDDLAHLLEVGLAHAGRDLENMRFELALRGQGRRDPVVAEMLAGIDRARMALFHEKFMRLTGDEKKASELASLFYLAIVGGNQALSRPGNPPDLNIYIASLITNYLIDQQAPAVPAKSRPAKKRA
ncbi:MAG: TetR/AcrR family transcriptional regulator [Pseudomonadota bacterium]